MGLKPDGTPNIVRQPGPMRRVEVGTLLDDVQPEELQAFPDRFQFIPDDQLHLMREQEANALAAREEADAEQATRQAEAAVAQAEQQARDAEAMAKEAHTRAEAVKKQAADRKELRARTQVMPAFHSDVPVITPGSFEAHPSVQGTDPGDVSGPAERPQHVIVAPEMSKVPGEDATEETDAQTTTHTTTHAAHRPGGRR